MERNNLSKEDKAMLLYSVMHNTLEGVSAREWQEKIIDAISEMGLTNAEIKSDCLYWLLEIYRMFGRISKIEPHIMD